jgi:molybdopterin adenylyltransferase
MQITVGIITISDRASAGDYADLGGPALKEAAQKSGWQVLCDAVIPDDSVRIQETIHSFARQGCGLILTTGGTGIAPRDVTPEAIRAIMRVELPGFGEVMRAESMKITPNSILSRNLAAIVDGEWCAGVSRIRGGRDPPRRGARATSSDFVLIGVATALCLPRRSLPKAGRRVLGICAPRPAFVV